MKVILTGTTGYVGEGVLLALLDDERIEQVLSVGRRPCGHTHPKLKEYIVPDLLMLQAGDPLLEGYDVCFFIAGITSVGTPADTYRIISHDIPAHFASILPQKEKMTFIYLSGAGTSDKGRLLWQQIKSSTERETQSMGFAHAYGWRPMFMCPYKGQTNHQVRVQKVVLILYPLLRLLGQICTMKEMVNAMYRVATDGFPKSNLEARDIIHSAKCTNRAHYAFLPFCVSRGTRTAKQIDRSITEGEPVNTKKKDAVASFVSPEGLEPSTH